MFVCITFPESQTIRRSKQTDDPMEREATHKKEATCEFMREIINSKHVSPLATYRDSHQVGTSKMSSHRLKEA